MKFFNIYDGQKRGAFVFKCLEENVNELRIMRGEECFPSSFEIIKGYREYDFHITDLFHVHLVSQRFVDTVSGLNATGVNFVEVTIPGVKGRYFGLSVSGRSGGFDDSIATLREVELTKGFKVKQKMGVRIHESTWDHSDFFVPEGSAAIVITERIAEALSSLTNICVRPLEDMYVA
jgi:hypothetical protein